MVIAHSVRGEVHEVVNRLSEEQLADLKEDLEFFLSGSTDRLGCVLDTAPIDEEPVTPEEEAAVAEAREDIHHGRTISMEVVKRLLLSGPSSSST